MLEQIDIFSPWIIVGATFALILLIILLIRIKKTARSHHNKPQEEISQLAEQASDLFNQTLDHQENEDDNEQRVFIQDRRAQDRRSNPSAPQNLDLLTEYEVYLQFGYLERAAKTLSYYLDSLEDPPTRLQKKLLKLYLLTKQIDEYSYLLEYMYHNKLIGKDNFQQAVVIGLKSDKNNLNLRLVAHTELDWGPEEILFQIGLGSKVKQQLHSTLTKTKNPSNEQKSTFTETKPDQNTSHGNTMKKPLTPSSASDSRKKNLINGQIKMGSLQLAPEEKNTLKGFIPAKTRAKFFMQDEDYDNAVQSFEEALKSEERPLTLLTNLLQIDFLTQNSDQFIKHYYAYLQSLGDQGEVLKKQMLEKGRSLGAHPFFTEIESAATPEEWAQIAKKYVDEQNLKESHKLKENKKPLIAVKDNADQEQNTASSQQETDEFKYASLALAQAQASLEYGQIEEAINTLETALLNKPEIEMLYPPLLNLYQRLDDQERFTQFHQKIRENGLLVPEKATLAINRLIQIFKNQKLETK